MNNTATFLAVIFVVCFMFTFGVQTIARSAKCNGPTAEQIMRMMPIYCGKDGCQ